MSDYTLTTTTSAVLTELVSIRKRLIDRNKRLANKLSVQMDTGIRDAHALLRNSDHFKGAILRLDPEFERMCKVGFNPEYIKFEQMGFWVVAVRTATRTMPPVPVKTIPIEIPADDWTNKIQYERELGVKALKAMEVDHELRDTRKKGYGWCVIEKVVNEALNQQVKQTYNKGQDHISSLNTYIDEMKVLKSKEMTVERSFIAHLDAIKKHTEAGEKII